jgi:hypothetical protein
LHFLGQRETRVSDYRLASHYLCTMAQKDDDFCDIVRLAGAFQQ